MIRVQDEKDIVFTEMGDGIAKTDLYKDIIENAIPGLVLFTSGSSGEPKAALHNFTKLLDKFRVKRKSLRTINFLLFDHWGVG